jgi:hypothetical protein
MLRSVSKHEAGWIGDFRPPFETRARALLKMKAELPAELSCLGAANGLDQGFPEED